VLLTAASSCVDTLKPHKAAHVQLLHGCCVSGGMPTHCPNSHQFFAGLL
jgi:hypothetical protein